MDNTQLLIEEIIKGIQEKKGNKIIIANLTEIDEAIADYLVICQGNSPTQVMAIVDSVKDFARIYAHSKPIAVDGARNAEWIAMDFADVVIHVFLPDVREYYDLENLWEDATITEIEDIE